MAHRVAPQAEADLDDIWFHVARESSSMDVATRLIDSITGRFFFLTTFPYAGRARDEDFGAGSRSFAVCEYVICVEGATFSFSGGYTADATSKRCSISDPGTSLGSRTFKYARCWGVNYRNSVTSSVTLITLPGPTSIFFAAANARSSPVWSVVKSRERNAITWYSPGTSPPMRNWPASSPLAPPMPVGLGTLGGGHLRAITNG